jgi:hypothetical protein
MSGIVGYFIIQYFGISVWFISFEIHSLINIILYLNKDNRR